MKKQKSSVNETAQNDGFKKMPNEMENSGFSDLNKFIPFHNFQENPVFEGKYLKTEFLEKVGKGGMNAHLFKTELGVKYYVLSCYTIDETIKTYGAMIYRFTFTGYTELDGGHKVKNFNVQGKPIE